MRRDVAPIFGGSLNNPSFVSRRAKHPQPVNPFSQKYSTLPKFGIAAYIEAARPDEEGRFASRSKRGPGCGGRGSVVRERRGQGG
ncbi:hypothetical protein ABIA00_002916 [Bradyrhizobium ottawaense]